MYAEKTTTAGTKPGNGFFHRLCKRGLRRHASCPRSTMSVIRLWVLSVLLERFSGQEHCVWLLGRRFRVSFRRWGDKRLGVSGCALVKIIYTNRTCVCRCVLPCGRCRVSWVRNRRRYISWSSCMVNHREVSLSVRPSQLTFSFIYCHSSHVSYFIILGWGTEWSNSLYRVNR